MGRTLERLSYNCSEVGLGITIFFKHQSFFLPFLKCADWFENQQTNSRFSCLKEITNELKHCLLNQLCFYFALLMALLQLNCVMSLSLLKKLSNLCFQLSSQKQPKITCIPNRRNQIFHYCLKKKKKILLQITFNSGEYSSLVLIQL